MSNPRSKLKVFNSFISGTNPILAVAEWSRADSKVEKTHSG